MKQMNRDEVRKLILREAKKILSERTDPSTLEISPDGRSFEVDAYADKPGEGRPGTKKRIKGRIEQYAGKNLAKAIPGEDYFNQDYTPRAASSQLSNQLTDIIDAKLKGNLVSAGMSQSQATEVATKVGRTKSQIFKDALSAIAVIANAIDDPTAKKILVKAIKDIANVQLGFEVGMPPGLDDDEG
jgi:hypothetical protein